MKLFKMELTPPVRALSAFALMLGTLTAEARRMTEEEKSTYETAGLLVDATVPGGTCSGSATHKTCVVKGLFDNDETTDAGRWLSVYNASGMYATYTFDEPKAVFAYRIANAAGASNTAPTQRVPQDFKIYGSNSYDGSSAFDPAEWTELDSESETGWKTAEKRFYLLDSQDKKTYSSYCLFVTTLNGKTDYCQLAEWDLYLVKAQEVGTMLVDATPGQWGVVSPAYGVSSVETDGTPTKFTLETTVYEDGVSAVDAGDGCRAVFSCCEIEKDGETVLTSTMVPFFYTVPSSYKTLSATWRFTGVEWRTVATAGAGGAVSINGGASRASVTNWAASGSVEVTAEPDEGFKFGGWSGDLTGATYPVPGQVVLPADRARTVTVRFVDEDSYTSADYVQDGLVLQLDGIDNAGRGIHDGTATEWKDLSPSGLTIRNSNTGAEWNWDDKSVYVGGSKPLALTATPVPINYHHVTYELYSVRDADAPTGYNVNHSYFWGSIPNGTKYGVRFNWYWNKNGTTDNSTIWTPGVNYAASLAYVDGSHVAREDENNVLTLWSSDTVKKTVTLAGNTSLDEVVDSSIAIGGKDASDPSWSRVYAFRAYDRALTDTEIRWNAAVDRARFAGMAVAEGEVKVAATPDEVASPQPGYGAVTVGVSTNNTFTIGGLVTDDYDGARVAAEYVDSGVRYVYTGCNWTIGVVNPTVGSSEEETVSFEKVSLFNDLTWNFRKDYRTIASSLEGGTVTVGGVSGACVTNFSSEGTLTIRATADEAAGYTFFQWTGDVEGIDDPKQAEIVVPVKSRNIVATYTWEDPTHVPVTTAWKPANASGAWNDAANWDNGVPQKGDTVVISNVTADTTLTVPVPTSDLTLLAVGNTNGKTTKIVQDGWNVSIKAATIDLGNGVEVTCADACTYGGDLQRVHLKGDRLFLRAGAKINANEKGYKAKTGPCWPNGSTTSNTGGGYAGLVDGAGQTAYGSAEQPTDPGSGGAAGPGGGAVRLEFSGAVVIDGDVTANGKYVYQTSGSGSGGSVWISAKTIAGSGRVLANARNPWEDNFADYRLTGGGGRVAVHYDTAAQAAVPCNIRFEARGGMSSKSSFRASTDSNSGNTTAWRQEPNGGPGTIWFSDNSFLTSETYLENGWKFAGVWMSSEPLTALTIPGNLLLDASFVNFPAGGFVLNVSGNLKATGVGFYSQRENGLVLSNGTVTIAGDLELCAARLGNWGGSISVGGNATLKSCSYKDQAGTTRNLSNHELGGGEIAITAAPTAEAGEVGATMTVGGTLSLAKNSLIRPTCDMDAGSIVAFAVKNLVMDAGSYVSATLQGFGDRRGPGAANTSNYAASYGGKGGAKSDYEGSVADTYGDEKRPLLPGSGAGNNTATIRGFKGGGVVYMTAAKSMTLNGTIEADGNRNHILRSDGGCPGSSGGSVYLSMQKLRPSTGFIYARGGVASANTSGNSNFCTGGGGRIAVWMAKHLFETEEAFEAFKANVSAAAGVTVAHDNYSITAWNDETHSEDGTVYWGENPGPGLMLLVR